MDESNDIAIIGLACRFPGARNADEFWQNLANGVESITSLSDEELLASGVPREQLTSPHYVKSAAVLDDPAGFDAAFFGFVPSEARTMDPQHRLLLELAHAALEDAGCDPARYPGRIGVFAGSAMNTYFMHAGLDQQFAHDYIPTLIVNDKDFLATRLSYKLNLKGPSLTVQTACSTSLVAVHLARQSLLSQETDIALAGAVSVRVPHRAGYLADGGGVTSPDGHVRAFDAHANGTLFGSGAGIVILKRLEDALKDGDTIRAIIKGSAVNNDGAEKAGYTAPSVNSQADAIVEALANADVEADDITYIEAHGSGTPVGDPIEVRALTKAFRSSTQRSNFCALGSVKTNIGHLDAAAGMAGLIKTTLALQHRQIPASLHYTQPNPEIDFPATPFFVNTKLTSWASPHTPRRAGIMSTGMGGTNAHVVLEEAPAASTAPTSTQPNLFVLSTRTESALATAADNLRAYLEANPTANLSNAAHTLQTGRRAMPHRRYIVGTTAAEIIASLATKPKRNTTAHTPEGTRRPLVFLFPGVGDQYVGMGRELYATFPVFRQEVDRCAEILRPLLGLDIRDILYPKNRDWQKTATGGAIDLKSMLAGNTQAPEDEDSRRLNQAVHVQPALFTIEYALARLWIDLGAQPRALVGHSMGEYVAACLSGVFSLEDALRLIVRRTQLAGQLPPARMLAVTLPESELQPLLPRELSISLINGPNLCVVAGPPPATEEFASQLAARSVIARPVQNTHAFHSRVLDPIVDAFAGEVRKVRLNAPGIPFISNVTGQWITAAEATDPQYWARHLNHTARFHDALQTLWQTEDPVLLEAGPGRTLGILAQQHRAKPASESAPPISSLRHHYENQPDAAVLLTAVGRLWLTGFEMHWESLPAGAPRQRIPLPTYPFEHSRFWLEPAGPKASATRPDDGLIHKNSDSAQWYFLPSWKSTAPRTPRSAQPSSAEVWLIFADETGFAAELVTSLTAAGQTVLTVHAADAFAQAEPRRFGLRPNAEEDYVRLMTALVAQNLAPHRIVHAWSVSPGSADSVTSESFTRAQERGFNSLALLARALARAEVGQRMRISIFTNGVQDVLGTECVRPEKSTILALGLVIPQEFSEITTECLDIEWPEAPAPSGGMIEMVTNELLDPAAEMFVAFRHSRRWVQIYDPLKISPPANHQPAFREGGAYLITGGLGRVGRQISSHLAQKHRARLVLIGRATLPERPAWDHWLQQHPAEDPVSVKLRHLMHLESLGSEVFYFAGDVANTVEMGRAIEEATRRFGALHGVIHGAGMVGPESYLEISGLRLDQVEAQLRAKAQGLLVLDRLLADRTLDFRLALSSLASILGGLGQAPYAAANIFMDSFARSQPRRTHGSWLSVNWDVWRTQENVWGLAGAGKTLAELGHSAAEAMHAMEVLLGTASTPQIIVSTGDLSARIRQWIGLEALRREARPASSAEAKISAPSHAGAPPASRHEMEEFIRRIWQDVLGMDEVPLDKTFFDLGGHSLLLIRVNGELRRILRRDLPMLTLFQHPTVATLARHLAGDTAERPAGSSAQSRADKLKQALAARGPAPAHR